ncbi:MAG: hypothetical protein ACFFBH_08560 [Promethearchaeota archaeon]
MNDLYQKFFNLLKEHKGEKLVIERKYLPEIIHEDGWQLNNDDGLPELKQRVNKTIRYLRVRFEYDKDLIILYIPENFLQEPDLAYYS